MASLKKNYSICKQALVEEEANEFLEACKDLRDAANTPANHFEVLKELSDLVFVCYQFAAAYGLDLGHRNGARL